MHRNMRPAYMAIIGDDEVENKTVSIRARNGEQKNNIPVKDFIIKINKEDKSRSKELELV